MKKILILIISVLCYTIYYLGIIKDVLSILAIGVVIFFSVLIMALCITIVISNVIEIYKEFKDWLKI